MLEFFYWEIFYKYMFIKKISKDIFFCLNQGIPHTCAETNFQAKYGPLGGKVL